MPHHRDLRVEDGPHGVAPNASAFELDALGSGSHEGGGVAHTARNVNVIAHPGHVRYHVRLGIRRRDRSNMVDHFLHGDVHGVALTHNHVRH